MIPAAYNFTIYQGKTFSRQMTLKDSEGAVVDLSAYKARMTLRQTYGSAALLSLNESSGITLAAVSPNITLLITDEQTVALDFVYAVYDLEIESPAGAVDPLLYGRVTLHREVTT